MIYLIKRFKCHTTPELVGKVEDWYTGEMERLKKRRSAQMALLGLMDKRECIMAFTEGTRTVAQVIDAVKKVFNTAGREDDDGLKPDTILLSSMHRAKGLEARGTWILGPELVPHPKAKTPKAQVQEYNLKYVAITRAIEQLAYVPLPRREETEE